MDGNRGRILTLALILGLTVLPLRGGDIRVSCGEPHSCFAPLVAQVLQEAGFDPEMLTFPLDRSLLMVARGEIYGEFFRTATSVEAIPGVVKVPVPLLITATVVLTMDPDLVSASPEVLRKLRVGVSRNRRFSMGLVEGWPHVILAPNDTLLLAMLQAGRFDVAIMPDVGILDLPEGALAAPMRILPHPLASTPLYFVIHEGRRDLLPRIQAAFEAWVKSGRWAAGVKALGGRPWEGP